jgi:hypothetical protein
MRVIPNTKTQGGATNKSSTTPKAFGISRIVAQVPWAFRDRAAGPPLSPGTFALRFGVSVNHVESRRIIAARFVRFRKATKWVSEARRILHSSD